VNAEAGPTDDVERALQREMLVTYPGESVRFLEGLDPEDAARVLERQPVELGIAVWERLSPDVARAVLARMPEEHVLEVLARVEPRSGALMLEGQEQAERERLLAALPESAAADLRTVLEYPLDRAGAIMDPRVRLFRQDMTAREVLSRLRADRRPGRRGFFVVDTDSRLTGWVDMQDIALARPNARLRDIAGTVLATIDAMASHEEVVETIDRHALSELAVVDLDGCLIGVIRQDRVVSAEKEQASVGIQTMVGVGKDERALSPATFAVRKRLPWLQINLATAFLAASVVGLFEATIAQFTALAVLLPVVAGQSGNTGAQALAVVMRGLALREVRASQWRQVVTKEFYVGLLNGIAVAVTTAAGVALWSGSFGLVLVIGVSMVLSMVIAGMAGAAIPVVLTVLGQDPAQSSSIILTTVTDVAGFFSFLGIATMLSGML